MKIGAALAADLGILTAALDEPGADVLHSLHQLGVEAQAAVPTYLGLSITVDGSDPPFTFSTLEDGGADDIRTSLRLTLPGVGDGLASTDLGAQLISLPLSRSNPRIDPSAHQSPGHDGWTDRSTVVPEGMIVERHHGGGGTR
jgi:hypothetical protein